MASPDQQHVSACRLQELHEAASKQGNVLDDANRRLHMEERLHKEEALRFQVAVCFWC